MIQFMSEQMLKSGARSLVPPFRSLMQNSDLAVCMGAPTTEEMEMRGTSGATAGQARTDTVMSGASQKR